MTQIRHTSLRALSGQPNNEKPSSPVPVKCVVGVKLGVSRKHQPVSFPAKGYNEATGGQSALALRHFVFIGEPERNPLPNDADRRRVAIARQLRALSVGKAEIQRETRQ